MGGFSGYEWDDDKDERNFAKHRIRFMDCLDVFRDENEIVLKDEAHSWGEQRLASIGLSGTELMFVVYVEREQKIRLISARFAEKDEWELYLSRW